MRTVLFRAICDFAPLGEDKNKNIVKIRDRVNNNVKRFHRKYTTDDVSNEIRRWYDLDASTGRKEAPVEPEAGQSRARPRAGRGTKRQRAAETPSGSEADTAEVKQEEPRKTRRTSRAAAAAASASAPGPGPRTPRNTPRTRASTRKQDAEDAKEEVQPGVKPEAENSQKAAGDTAPSAEEKPAAPAADLEPEKAKEAEKTPGPDARTRSVGRRAASLKAARAIEEDKSDSDVEQAPRTTARASRKEAEKPKSLDVDASSQPSSEEEEEPAAKPRRRSLRKPPPKKQKSPAPPAAAPSRRTRKQSSEEPATPPPPAAEEAKPEKNTGPKSRASRAPAQRRGAPKKPAAPAQPEPPKRKGATRRRK